VQETWLTAVRRVRTFRPEQGPFAGWLCGVSANLIRNRLRAARRQSPKAGRPDRSDVHGSSGANETGERVARALAELPPHYEAVLRAKYFDGLNVQTIAGRRGESLKAVESLLTRARQAFRDAYQSAGAADG
jgi:RNA polymerase sigma-70 factor (ECF subfamily)